MVRYFYAWSPFFIVGTVALLSLPYLGLVALMVVALGALVAVASLAWAIVAVPYMLGHVISRRLQARRGLSPRSATALSPAEHREGLAHDL